MSTVKQILSQKERRIISVQTSDSVLDALQKMRDNRVRSMMVIDNDKLEGIVSQGDCAIKVLLNGLSAKTTKISQVMTPRPLVVDENFTAEQCMSIMTAKRIRHLPVLKDQKVVGLISIGDLVKEIMKNQDSQISFLENYIKGHGVEY
jgi:CBS domain-containing protein